MVTSNLCCGAWLLLWLMLWLMLWLLLQEEVPKLNG
jgi:hypothetical protein